MLRNVKAWLQKKNGSHTNRTAESAKEIDWEHGARQINDCEYLLVEEIRPLNNLALGLVIVEAKAQDRQVKPKNSSDWEKIFADAKPIEPDPSCRLFQLLFDENSMISYSVLNESYSKYPESYEQFTGKLFRLFSSSYLLDYTAKSTIASAEYPGPLQHYQIATLNHVIDVISTKPPRISIGKCALAT